MICGSHLRVHTLMSKPVINILFITRLPFLSHRDMLPMPFENTVLLRRVVEDNLLQWNSDDEMRSTCA